MSNEQADKQDSLKARVQEILLAVVNDKEPYRNEAGFTRWGRIQADINAAIDVAFVPSSIEPTTFDLKDTLHKVVNNLLEHGGEHYKRMFGRSGSCIFTNAEVGAIREVVFRALKAKLSATASIRVPRDQLIEWALWLKGRREVAGQVSMDSIETAILDLLNAPNDIGQSRG